MAKTERTCPSCGEESLDRIEVDIGVGTQYGPWQCFNCDWEQGCDDPLFKELNHDY